ncbi:UNVERIFIED_ORG: hypothetical protein BCL66_103324 [Martelella mediterranea]
MAQLYRSRVQGLYDAPQGEDEEKRTEAADIIRTLVEDIVLTLVDGKVEIDVCGDLAEILTFSVQTKNPAGGAGLSQVKMVAGGRTHRNLQSPCPLLPMLLQLDTVLLDEIISHSSVEPCASVRAAHLLAQ